MQVQFLAGSKPRRGQSSGEHIRPRGSGIRRSVNGLFAECRSLRHPLPEVGGIEALEDFVFRTVVKFRSDPGRGLKRLDPGVHLLDAAAELEYFRSALG